MRAPRFKKEFTVKAKVINIENKEVGSVDLSDEIFATKVNKALLYENVKMQLANRRKGTSSCKSRGEVNATTAKMYRQKGTGRARHGSMKAGIFVGGGKAFGPKPRDYSYEIPKKARKAGLRSALSVKSGEGRLIVLDEFPIKEIKTKPVVAFLKTLGIESCLLVVDAKNEKLEKSVRNIKHFKLIRAEGINVYDLLRYDHAIIMKQALEKVQEVLKP